MPLPPYLINNSYWKCKKKNVISIAVKEKKNQSNNLKFGGKFRQSEMNKVMDQDLVTESLSLAL